MKFKTLIALFLALLIVTFSLQNAEVTEIDFMIWTISMSRVLIILGSFAFGVLTGILFASRRRFTNTKY